jgi:hypothetical protein
VVDRASFPFNKTRGLVAGTNKAGLPGQAGGLTRLASWLIRCIDLKRITRYNLRIARVGHFWKCYGSEASKS